MNILNLMIYIDISVLVGAIIVIAMQNMKLNKKCNEILNR